MTEAVIFDMDGVLTDSEPVINAAAIAALREFGVRAEPADFAPFVGTGEDSYIGGVARRHGHAYVPEMKHRVYQIYLEMLPGRIKAFPGVHALIRSLRRQGILLAVASSADRIKVQANLEAIAIDLADFGAIVVGEDIVHKKPAPDCFLHAAAQLQVPPERCCVIEDAVNGVLAAKAAGMRCVAVAQSFSPEVLLPAHPDVIRAGMAEITRADLDLQPGHSATPPA